MAERADDAVPWKQKRIRGKVGLVFGWAVFVVMTSSILVWFYNHPGA